VTLNARCTPAPRPTAVSAIPITSTGPGRSAGNSAARLSKQADMTEGRTGIWRPSTFETKRNARLGFRRSAKPNKLAGGRIASSTLTSRTPRLS
jgi:hypothetical protein